MSCFTDYDPIKYLERRGEYYRKKMVWVRNGGMDKILSRRHFDEREKESRKANIVSTYEIKWKKFVKAANALKRMNYLTL